MEERPYRKRRGGSLVFPIILIVLGVLFLLENLNITSGIDWATIWKLWPIVIIALGLEILLGRRVSFGAVFLIVLIFIVAGAALWWMVVAGDGERTTEHFSWEMGDFERAELDLDIGVGELKLDGYSDMADLLVADLEQSSSVDVRQKLQTDGDVARGSITTEGVFFAFPQIFGGHANEWDLLLNSRVTWELDIHSGVGDTRIDLSDLRVSNLRLDAGVGSVNLTMPRRGTVKARVDGGVGDIHITIPEGMQARVQVDRGIGDLDIDDRFRRRGDYYETEDFSDAESYIDLQVDLGIGSVTIR